MRADPPVRVAGGADRVAAAAMLGRAFADDPAFGYVFPDPADRARRLPRLFALMLEPDVKAGMALVTEGAGAATLWRAPGRAVISWPETLARAWPLWRALGGGMGRALSVGRAIEAHLPAGDFWYLHVAGCDPARRGEGLGTAAVRAGLRRAAGRLPCRLETATEANIAFYARLGFAVTGEWTTPGGPRFWSMLRPADG